MAIVAILALATSVLDHWGLPPDPNVGLSNPIDAPPSWTHWYGTDHWGCDACARPLAGSGVAPQMVPLPLGLDPMRGRFKHSIANVYGADPAIHVSDLLFRRFRSKGKTPCSLRKIQQEYKLYSKQKNGEGNLAIIEKDCLEKWNRRAVETSM